MNTKKKLKIIKKTKKNNKMNEKVVKKQITTQRDLRTILSGYVKTGNFNSIPEWLEIYKSDFPGALDKDTLNSLLSHTQSVDFSGKEEMEMYLELLLQDNPETDYNETTYTSFIKIYSDIRYTNVENVKKYLLFMIQNGIKIKRRTLGPVFEMCRNKLDIQLCLSIYNIVKSRNLILNDEDYCNILSTFYGKNKKDYFNIINVIDDLFKTHYILNHTTQEVFDKIFPKNICLNILNDGTIETEKMDIPIKKMPEFKFSSKDMILFSEKMEHHVSNIHPKKKTLLLAFKKFLKKQKYDTVIDGANVGFFKQGVNSGKVLNFNQIRLFVDKAIEVGRKVLLILHERHIRNIKKSDLEVLNYIKSKVCHFFSPQGMDDDMYWLYSTIMNPKANIITNDEMRNHIVNISVGDMFTEWKKYKVIKYNLIGKEVILNMPPKYMCRPILEDNKMIIPFQNEEERINWKYYTY